MRNVALLLVGLISVGAISFAGCGDDDDDSPSTTAGRGGAGGASGAGGMGQTQSGIKGTISYNGSQRGDIVPTLWSKASGFRVPPPADFVIVMGAVGPSQSPYELKDVPPGEYYIEAYMSVGVPHYMGPSGKDPRGVYEDEAGQPKVITVVAGQSATADFELFDQAAGGAGGGGGEGGGAGQGGGGGAAGAAGASGGGN